MTNWKKGDIAICIDNSSMGHTKGRTPPLRKNAEYIVAGINICACGQVSLDVGISASENMRLGCHTCDRVTLNEPIWFCDEKRFVKKQSLEEQKAEALKQENYELLAELHKETN